MQSRTSLPSWQTLVQHANNIKSHHMSDMFCEDKNRFSKFSIQLNPFLLDYSKKFNYPRHHAEFSCFSQRL